MNGPHDMGGQHCHGPVIPEKNEPVFHADWEKNALALTVAMGFTGSWNIDISRFARESIAPADYLAFSYYEIWIAGLIKLMLQRGMVAEEELATGKAHITPVAIKNILKESDTEAALAAGGPADRSTDRVARFNPGDRVRTLNLNPEGHTRLPRYARRAQGEIASVHGCHVFPDSSGIGKGEDPQWLYSVRFSATELFGTTADPIQDVLIDCWEPYLESR